MVKPYIINVQNKTKIKKYLDLEYFIGFGDFIASQNNSFLIALEGIYLSKIVQIYGHSKHYFR